VVLEVKPGDGLDCLLDMGRQNCRSRLFIHWRYPVFPRTRHPSFPCRHAYELPRWSYLFHPPSTLPCNRQMRQSSFYNFMPKCVAIVFYGFVSSNEFMLAEPVGLDLLADMIVKSQRLSSLRFSKATIRRSGLSRPNRDLARSYIPHRQTAKEETDDQSMLRLASWRSYLQRATRLAWEPCVARRNFSPENPNTSWIWVICSWSPERVLYHCVGVEREYDPCSSRLYASSFS
jgi:hypothetical protein